MRIFLTVAATIATTLFTTAASAEVKFKKIKVDDLFRSEGVAIGDINKDGKTDLCVGDIWYEAPDWKIHEIRKPREPKRGGYTEGFGVYSGDFNKDGWVDFLVIPFHGKDAKWYENPKGKFDAHWKEYFAFPKTGNETRIYPDLFQDGKRVFLMGIDGQIAWAEVPADPTKPWPVHGIGEKGDVEKTKGPAHKFAHGLGAGDINGDGKWDVIVPGGWYEHPVSGRAHTGLWKFHKTQTTDRNTADIYAVDADGDGRNDIFASSAHGKGIFFSKHGGPTDEPTFKRSTLHDKIRVTHSLNYVDINGDGKKDLVTGQRPGTHGSPNMKDPSELFWFEIVMTKGQIPTLIPHEIDTSSGMGAQFVTADFNGDKKIDVIVSGRKGVYIFLQE
jgi:hypothetical protein